MSSVSTSFSGRARGGRRGDGGRRGGAPRSARASAAEQGAEEEAPPDVGKLAALSDLCHHLRLEQLDQPPRPPAPPAARRRRRAASHRVAIAVGVGVDGGRVVEHEIDELCGGEAEGAR